MSVLIFGSRLRSKAIGWLFSHPEERFHVRRLGAILAEDSTNLSRGLARLAKEGLLVATAEGRQKYYQANAGCPIFAELKGIAVKTGDVTESREPRSMIAERPSRPASIGEKAGRIPVDKALLSEIVRRIVERIHPHKILLFGSRSRGDAKPTSDLDLLVIAESDLPRWRRSAPLYGALSDIPVPMDILVFRPEEVEEWSEVPQAFVTTAVREGTVLYEEQS